MWVETISYNSGMASIIGLNARMPGVIIGTIVILLFYARTVRLHVWHLLDVGAVSLYLFIFIYRVGCVLNGCCYGISCDLPWAVVYTHSHALAPLWIPLHPTQIYHLVWTMVVFAIVWTLKKRPYIAGVPAFIALIIYSAGDFVIRFFRADEPSIMGISLSQITALLQIALAVFIIFYLTTARQKRC